MIYIHTLYDTLHIIWYVLYVMNYGIHVVMYNEAQSAPIIYIANMINLPSLIQVEDMLLFIVIPECEIPSKQEVTCTQDSHRQIKSAIH